MTIAFLDEQMTGRGQVRRPARTHTASRRSAPGRVYGGAAPTHAVVRPLRPTDRTVAAAPVPAVAVAAPRTLRLTRRGRVVFGTLLVVLVLIVFSLGRFTAGADASAPPLRVTVSTGDTLWSIAQQAEPGSDPRDVVDRIVAANHLSTSSLVPGAVLVIPRG